MKDAHKSLDVFRAFLKLGLTSFGGPVAHLGYFRHEFVEKRDWLSDRVYADIVGLCQFLPGPASSQVALTLGLVRAGYAGAFAAWLGFTLPSALFMILFGYGLSFIKDAAGAGWIHGLKIAAFAVVLQAVLAMGRRLTPDGPRLLFAAVIAALALWLPGPFTQIIAIAAGGVFGIYCLKNAATQPHAELDIRINKRISAACLAVFAALLLALPLAAGLSGNGYIKVFDVFYRAGALVFGGGHVVLPLLQSAVVDSGWVDKDTFMAGYGAAQAVPGPLFTFAAYLGSTLHIGSTEMSGWAGGALCLFAIFMPSFLLMIGVLPFWEALRHNTRVKSALQGVNAAVVGILLAALYNPVATTGILDWHDLAIGFFAFILLDRLKISSWAVVFLTALLGLVPL